MLVATLATLRPLPGQTVRIGLDATTMSYVESDSGHKATGKGIGGRVEARYRRWALDAKVFRNRLDPSGANQTNFDVTQIDLRLRYHIAPLISLEAGGGRRYVRPTFAAQEVGSLRFGVYSETDLARIAQIWVRGAYLVGPRFDGRGKADIAFEFGLGVGVGTKNGRFRVQSDYEFQRIDRKAGGFDVPLQMQLVRSGVAVGF